VGYEGSYDRVAAFARGWRQAQREATRTTGRGTFIPLTFAPGEAFQFDWSEDWAVIAGVKTKLQVAQLKLSYSRAFILRAYPLRPEKARLQLQLRHVHESGAACTACERADLAGGRCSTGGAAAGWR